MEKRGRKEKGDGRKDREACLELGRPRENKRERMGGMEKEDEDAEADGSKTRMLGENRRGTWSRRDSCGQWVVAAVQRAASKIAAICFGRN